MVPRKRKILLTALVVGATSTVAGIGFGGFRVLMRKLGQKQDPGAMIVLNLRDK